MDGINRQIVLAARPEGAPGPEHFRLVEGPVPVPGPGQVLIRQLYLSLDPYMRGRMNAGRSYAAPVALGAVMVGGTVGRVVASNHPGLAAGDLVAAYGGWQDYAVAEGGMLERLDPAEAPVTTALGVLGMPGLTAYAGLTEIGRPKAGETVVVAAASGAVGSVVGQVARILGARAVGIAGGAAKCAHVVGELGFDACVDHRAADLPAALARACPNGIDVYFENVGGAVWEAVFPLLNDFARIPVCGLIAQYNARSAPAGGLALAAVMRAVLTRRLTLRGFIVSDFWDKRAEFRARAAAWIREGRLRYREDIVEGLENAPAALIGLLEGRNFGKLLIRIAPEA